MPVPGRWCTALIAAALFLQLSVASGDTLRRGTAAEPGSLDPQIVSGNASAILRDLGVGLTTFGVAGEIIPGAAESWEISDDGLAYRFELRDGLEWSDGEPIDAGDFVFSMRRLLTPDTGGRFGTFFYSLKNAREVLRGDIPPNRLGVSSDGDRTVIIELERPDALLLEKLAGFAASPVPRHVIEEHGRGWSRPGRVVSNGPYRLKEWVPQSHLTLEKNPHFYAADTVIMQTVRYYPTTNVETAMRRYLAGELDILLRFPPDRREWIDANLPGQLRVWPALGLAYIVFNHRMPPFDDVRVRRALSISVDREQLVERIMPVGFSPAHTLTPDVVSNYDPPLPEFANQPLEVRQQEARRLLAEAGYTKDRPLTFEYRYEPLEESRRVAVALQAKWREIGVNASLLHTDFGTLHRSVRTGDFTAARFAWFAPTDDPETFLGVVESTNPNNHGGYRNEEVDRLIADAETSLNQAERLATFRRAEAIALEEYPALPLFFIAYRYLVAPDIRGFEPNARGVNASRYISRDANARAR